MNHPALNAAILVSPVENGYVAYDPVSDRLHELNPLAALILELCDGTRSVEEIRRLVGPLLSEGRSSEIDRWIKEGIDAGLLTNASISVSHRELSAAELTELAERLRDRGKIQTALLCRQRAAELSPGDAQAWSSLDEVAHIAGRREQARTAYEKYLQLRPDDAEIKHILVALRDEAPPPRVPDECIQQLYRRFSRFYETNVCEELDYQGPRRIQDLVSSVLGGRFALSVLDLGCGSGLAGAQFRERAARLVGVDLSPEMIDLARARGIYDALEVAEITRWLMRSHDQFDVVVACDSLIYFGDLSQVIASTLKCLKEGGVFAFTLERSNRYPFELSDSGRYTHHPNYVREACAEAGLSVELLEEGYLRMEYGADVTGLFAVVKRPELRREMP